MKSVTIIILAVLVVAGVSYAQPPLKPAVLFTNVSTIGAGTPVNLWSQPDSVAWTLATYGNLSTFEVTIDGSIDFDCDAGFYYVLSTMTEATTVLGRGISLDGERCVRANLRSKTGFGGISTIKLLPRGDQR